MKRFQIPSATVIITICFFVFSVLNCGGSGQSTKHLEKYDSYPYQDIFTLNVSKDGAYKAAVNALQQQGYLITLSDPQTGLINAEINSPALLPEEIKAEEQSKGGTSVWTILLAILGVVLLFGLIGSMDGCSDSSKKTKTRTDDHTYYPPPQETKTTSYRYVVTLTTTELDANSTGIKVSAVRMVLENGSVASSGRIENKYLNYNIIDAIEAQLGR